MSGFIRTGIDYGVLELSIDRPESKNAITIEMYSELAQKLRDADASSEVRAIVLTDAAGVFTAGNDVQDFVASPPDTGDAPVWNFFRSPMNARQPVISAVDGAAIGIGPTMLLHADFVFATQRSFFAMPFTRLGITPEGAASVLLPLFVGRVKASDLLLCGSRISAEEAFSLGLVNAVVDPNDLRATVHDRARLLASLPFEAIQRTKRLLKVGLESLVAQQFASEQESVMQLLPLRQQSKRLCVS